MEAFGKHKRVEKEIFQIADTIAAGISILRAM